MASKEAEKYVENLIADYSDYHKFDDELTALTSAYWENIPVKLDDVLEAFDAGVESVNKRVGDVNDYYDQLSGMSEDYQAGYIQAEKDMPKQFEAVHDIIKLQKEVDALKLENAKLVEKLKSRLSQDEIEDKV